MTQALPYLTLAALAGLVVAAVNVAYWLRTRHLTAEERRALKEETAADLRIW